MEENIFKYDHSEIESMCSDRYNSRKLPDNIKIKIHILIENYFSGKIDRHHMAIYHDNNNELQN